MKLISFLFLIVLVISISFSATVNLIGGEVYYLNVSTYNETEKWVGLNIEYSKGGTNTFYSNSSGVYNVTFLESDFTVVVPNKTTFNYLELESVNSTDLLKDHLFSSTLFSVFYPNYYSSDGPNATFCCNLVKLVIKNKAIYVYEIKVAGESEYLAKYHGLPAFIVVGAKHMILPVNVTYYIYSVVFPTTKPTQRYLFPQEPKKLEVNYTLLDGKVYFYVSHRGAPVSGAVVSLYFNDTKIAELITDGNGVCEFELEEGNYSVKVYKKGYEGVAFAVSYFPNYVIYLNSTLFKVGDAVCFSIYKDNLLTNGLVIIRYPNGTQGQMFVDGFSCINASDWGLFEIKFKSAEEKFIVFPTIPQVPQSSEWNLPLWKIVVVYAIILILLLVILVPIIIYFIKKSKDKFKELLKK